VARRRLKRPPKHAAHLLKNRAHVPLAEAGIDRVASKVDAKSVWEDIDMDDQGGGDQKKAGTSQGLDEGEEGDEEEPDENSLGVKVPG
jgi:hypothetical protein